MDNTNKQFKASFHFKDEWTDSATGNLINSEVSTEIKYANSQSEIDEIIEDVKHKYEGRAWGEVDGVIHSRTLLGVDSYKIQPRGKLTKEEMFDFILNNDVQLTISNAVWQKTDGTKERVKYHVSINDHNMAGFHLEEAIQYYYDNHIKRG